MTNKTKRSPLNYCFWLLRYCDRTEKEIREKLSRKKYGSNAIRQTMDKLKKLGLINDKKFTINWINYRLSAKKGLNLIKLELRKKSVPEDIIKETIEEFQFSPETEIAQAEEIFYKKIKQYKKLTPDKVYRRLGGFLARQGYSMETVKQIFRKWNDDFKEKLAEQD